jgi:hypothetical protein
MRRRRGFIERAARYLEVGLEDVGRPIHLDRVASDFPNLKIIGAHRLAVGGAIDFGLLQVGQRVFRHRCVDAEVSQT